MRHDLRDRRSDRDLIRDCGDLIAEEARADDLRAELAASCDRIHRLKAKFGWFALEGRTRQIYADPYVEGEGYTPRLIEIYPDGTVCLSPVERLSDLIAPAVTAEPAAIEAAHAASEWDRPGDDDTPLTDEMVLAALRAAERDTDD